MGAWLPPLTIAYHRGIPTDQRSTRSTSMGASKLRTNVEISLAVDRASAYRSPDQRSIDHGEWRCVVFGSVVVHGEVSH